MEGLIMGICSLLAAFDLLGYIKDIILFNTNDISSAFAPSLGDSQMFGFQGHGHEYKKNFL
jgi:hypothetical protein